MRVDCDMFEVDSAHITTERGVGNDRRGKPGRRQVTVLTRDGWNAALGELGIDLPWIARRANLYIDGVQLAEKTGHELVIGDAVLLITGETSPCQIMNLAHAGLMQALKPNWRAGVTCRVIRSGTVRIGSPVELRTPSSIGNARHAHRNPHSSASGPHRSPGSL